MIPEENFNQTGNSEINIPDSIDSLSIDMDYFYIQIDDSPDKQIRYSPIKTENSIFSLSTNASPASSKCCVQTKEEIENAYKQRKKAHILPKKQCLTKEEITVSENSIFKVKKHYTILDAPTKRKIVNEAKTKTIKELSEKYGVSVRSITRWKNEGVNDKKNSGRRPQNPKLERDLVNWYTRNQGKRKITSRNLIEMAKRLTTIDFKIDFSYVYYLKRKYNFIFDRRQKFSNKL